MTTIKAAVAALALVAGFAAAAPVFAQDNADDEGRKCSFVAEKGGYVCEEVGGGESLSDGTKEWDGLLLVWVII